MRRRKPRWALRVATGLSVVVLASAGIGHSVLSSLDADLGRVDPFKDMKNRPRAGHGMNILLVGTDGRDRITEAERRRYRLGGAPCHCTDTIMIVHISEDRERASVVSLPRDSYAVTPAHTDAVTGKRHHAHPLKLNAAYAEGGPQLTVRTVEQMTRVKIDHYLEVDFVSFMKTVDELGGVKICTAQPLKDSYTGLDLAPGTHTLTGGQALQYVRARHVDGAADLGRMKRQQRFLAALVDRATSSGVLFNPLKFRDVTRAVLGSVRADKGFGTGELLDLGRAMRNFSPSSSEFTTVPIGQVAYAVNGIGSTVKWDPARAEALFERLREDRPLAAAHRTGGSSTPPPASRSTRNRSASRWRTAPRRRASANASTPPFAPPASAPPASPSTRPGTTCAVRSSPTTPRWDRSARSLAAALPGSELRAVKGQGPVLKVIVGGDFRNVRTVRAEEPARAAAPVVRGNEVACPS
ncbi:LCP family protein [Streptomyces thermocoprophilus]